MEQALLYEPTMFTSAAIMSCICFGGITVRWLRLPCRQCWTSFEAFCNGSAQIQTRTKSFANGETARFTVKGSGEQPAARSSILQFSLVWKELHLTTNEDGRLRFKDVGLGQIMRI